MILDDVLQGVALYKMSATDRLKTFSVPCTQRRSRNVAFHDGGKTIVTGSDHGNVYLFHRRTGEIDDVIDIGVKDWVQSITVSNDCESHWPTELYDRRWRWRVFHS